ncbi:MAG: Gfo/Idh/MocA family protein [Phycisphaerae bacterium]
MAVRFAFAGFRHGHILDLVAAVKERPDLELVAACEDDPETGAQLAAGGKVEITHQSLEAMLKEVDCDVVAIADYYSRRGSMAIAALNAGRHVIADKPLCTSLQELRRIERIAARKKLAVGEMLDLRACGACQAAKDFIDAGQLGQVHTLSFSGQHPLMYGKRAGWYFEEGKHGGTINDIFIHAADMIEWLLSKSGRRIVEVVAARTWNTHFAPAPKFPIGAQLMLRLDNGGGVLGDVSYLAPDKCGYSTPQYWRFVVHGSRGVMEFNLHSTSLMVATHDDDAARQVPVKPSASRLYLDDFLRQIRGESQGVWLTTAQVIRATRIALTAQRAADTNRAHLKISP